MGWAMGVRARTAGLGVLLALLLGDALAAAADLRSVRLWRAPDNTRLVFDLSGPVQHSVFTLSAPNRIVIDAAGASITLKIALDIVRPAGWISKVGWGPQPLQFNLDPLVQKNITLQGSFSHNWPIWERVIALLSSGQLDVKPIIGGVWALEDWHDAFEKMHRGEVVKSVLRPG